MEECEPFRDMLIYAAGEKSTILHHQWIVWQKLITRFHLFGTTGITTWMGLIARFDTRNVRTPSCLARIPFNQLVAAEWELSHPDMMAWIRRAARQDTGEFDRTLPTSEMTPKPDFQGLISSLRARTANSTNIVSDYEDIKKEFNLPPDYESLSNSDKSHQLQTCGSGITRILEFLHLGAQRNTLRAFAGSRRPAASGMQCYKTSATSWKDRLPRYKRKRYYCGAPFSGRGELTESTWRA